ncbi:unnamed protein product [Caenorhabditis angaria]|uniref:ACB domain-containing protein n=1 Tax=Caenorhabditis angaria TaxID=860376 RepID=A0A9P1ILN5_9PELO|nr:unnamed protein product [Caenorhabditis angaria]
MPSLDEQFEAAVWIIKSLPKKGPIQPSIQDQLEMYSLFKQATIGECKTEQPYFYQVEDRLKWNAWNDLGTMEKDEAKARYIEKMLKMVEKSESEHNLMDYLDDPSVGDLVNLQDEFREKFAILGRTSMKGHEGKTVTVNGVEVKL